MLEIFQTRKLVQSVNGIRPAPSFMVDTFFSNVDANTAEHIDVEIYDGKRKLAPFVSPRIEGKLIESQGKSVSSYKPAYIKFKYVTEAEQVAAEANGIFYADNKTPTQRAVDKAVREFEEGVNSIVRRIESMATSALTTGTVSIIGDGVDDVVDFQMKATHLKTLTGTALWTDAASDPIVALRAWKREVVKDSGVMPDRCVMGSAVIDAFVANAKVQNYLDKRRIDLGSVKPTNIGDGATYWGQVEGLDIYSYDAYYTDSAGVEQELFPANKVLLGSTIAKTVLNYGAIKDLRSGSFVGAIFTKTWEEEDPSSRIVLFQSAPLPVPTQINAFMCNQVV